MDSSELALDSLIGDMALSFGLKFETLSLCKYHLNERFICPDFAHFDLNFDKSLLLAVYNPSLTSQDYIHLTLPTSKLKIKLWDASRRKFTNLYAEAFCNADPEDLDKNICDIYV